MEKGRCIADYTKDILMAQAIPAADTMDETII